MSVQLRKDDILFPIGDAIFRKCDALDLTKAPQLPTYKYVIERCHTILSSYTLREKNKREKSLTQIVNECRYTWIFMNILSKTYNGTKLIIQKEIATVDRLCRTHQSKRGAKWKDDAKQLLSKLDNGIDIRSCDEKVIDEIVNEYGVVPGPDEEALFRDNCSLEEDNGNKLTKCLRKMWCGGVDSSWWKEAQKREEKMKRLNFLAEQRQSKILKDQIALTKLKSECSLDQITLEIDNENTETESSRDMQDDDEEYTPGRTCEKTVEND